MNLKKQQLISLTKYASYSGIFGIISFIFFYAAYDGLKPELEIFLKFFKRHSLDSWIHLHIGNLEALGLLIAILVLSSILATIGLIAAIFAKFLHDKAVETLKVK